MKLKSIVQKYFSEITIALLISATVTFHSFVRDLITKYITMENMITILFILLINFSAYICVLLYRNTKLNEKLLLTKELSFLWDNNLNPHCNSCHSLMIHHPVYKRPHDGNFESKLHCIKCKSNWFSNISPTNK